MARIFISHSSKDNKQAEDLKAWLASIGFEQAFLDFDKHTGIPPGADWERTLYREIERAQAVILILTKNWFDSKWCFAEFTQTRALGKSMFALVESPKGETKVVSSDIQHLDLINDRAEGLERLGRELTRVALNSQGGFHWQAGRAPYPGLLSFDTADAAIFFGRDDDVLRAIERINARRVQGGPKLIAILGSSGSGKSSLLKAGILPRIARDQSNFLVVPAFRPGSNPIANFLAALRAIDPTVQPADVAQIDNGEKARAFIERLRSVAKAPQATLIIAVDQAEECFTNRNQQAQRDLFKLLSALLSDDNPALCVATLRSDHLPDLQVADGLSVPFQEFSLKPMPIERLGLIVKGPAAVVGLSVEESLVSALTRDVRTHHALPLVAFVLRRLYDRYASGGALLQAHYELMRDGELSPLAVAVRDAAGEALAMKQPAPDELAALREAFVPSLVRVNDEGGFVRQSASLADLPPKAHGMLRALADNRLLVIDDGIIEVAHEALFQVWPLLAQWLEEEREFLVGKSRIEKSREDYVRLPAELRPKGLLAGILLERAKGWLIAHPNRFSAEEVAFIRDSIAEAERKERELAEQRERVRQAELATAKAEAERARHQAATTRKFLRFAVAAAVALAIFGGTAVYYWIATDAAQRTAKTNFNLAIDQAASNVDMVVDNYQAGRIATGLLNALIARAQSTVDDLHSDTADAAAAKAELLRAVGRAYLVTSQASTAEKKAREELAITDRFLALNPTAPEWIELEERAQEELGQCLYWRGDLAGALQYLRTAMTAAQGLVDRFPDNKDYAQDLIEIYRFAGDSLRNQANIDQAQVHYQSWLDLADKLAERDPAEGKWLRDQIFARQRVGDVFIARSQGAEAGIQFQSYLMLAQEGVKREPDNKEFIEAVEVAHERIGDAYFIQGDTDHAVSEYQIYRQLAEKLATADQSNFLWNQDLEVAHQRLGEVYLRKEDFVSAAAEFAIYFEMANDTLAKDQKNGTAIFDVANALEKVGDALRGQKRYAEALMKYRSMRDYALDLKGLDVSNAVWTKGLAMSYQRVALTLELQGDTAGALESYKSCAATPLPSTLWGLRDLWPADVTEYCRQKVAALAATPR
jgi:tetratricopeptide (TPR) repeat protein